MVITASIRTIDRTDKRTMCVDSIFKANVTTVIGAGNWFFIRFEVSSTRISFLPPRYDHVRPKPRMPTIFHRIAFTPDPPYEDSSPPPSLPNPVVHKPLIVNGAGTFPAERERFILNLCFFTAPMSYANVCRLNNDVADSAIYIEPTAPSIVSVMLQSLCPYAEKDGYCEALETGRYCPYIHGDLCDLCEMPALHPTNEKQREQHRFVRIVISLKRDRWSSGRRLGMSSEVWRRMWRSIRHST